MFEINNDFKNLDVDSYKVNNKATVYLVPVVAPIIREGKSKDSTIKTFKKNIETAGIVRSFDIGVNNENEKEPFREFSDIEYVVTDLNSLKHIKENKRFNMNFGLRYFIPEIDENKNSSYPLRRDWAQRQKSKAFREPACQQYPVCPKRY